jgi:hypothetical protein
VLHQLNSFFAAHPAVFELFKVSVPFFGTLLTALAAWCAVVANNRAARRREREKLEHDLRVKVHLDVAEALEGMLFAMLQRAQMHLKDDQSLSQQQDILRAIGRAHLVSSLNTVKILFSIQSHYTKSICELLMHRNGNQTIDYDSQLKITKIAFERVLEFRELHANYIVHVRQEIGYAIDTEKYLESVKTAADDAKKYFDELLAKLQNP